MKLLSDSVSIHSEGSVSGLGTFSRTACPGASSFGVETPIIALQAFHSSKHIPACAICFIHALPFADLVERLVRLSEDSKFLNDSQCPTDWFSCRYCVTTYCKACTSEAVLSVHKRYCGQGDVLRSALVRRLSKLGYMHSESLVLACMYLAQFSHPFVQLPDYFKISSRTNQLGLIEGFEITKDLLEDPSLELNTYQAVVNTFDRSNLYLEIQNRTMLNDIENGSVSTERLHRLSEAQEILGFAALTDEVQDGTAFPIPVVVGSAHYRSIAFMNHSCDPNVEWVSGEGTNCIELVSLREIRVNEELRISYVDQSLGMAERRERLLELYGFHCACERCTEEGRWKNSRENSRENIQS